MNFLKKLFVFILSLIILILIVITVLYLGNFSNFSYKNILDNDSEIEDVKEFSDIVESARKQIGVTISYDPSYVSLKYPMGDVSMEKGVCSDVVVRALRDARGMDLQELIHNDMKNNFSKYPKNWGLKKPDSNIDHRRVPNIRRFFEHSGYGLTVSKNPKDYLAGDIVTSLIFGKPHIMIVSNKKTFHGRPYVIHNIGRGTQEEDILFYYPLTGHYRIIDKKKTL